MLGAQDTLADAGMTVIAAEAQQGQWILDRIREAAGRRPLGRPSSSRPARTAPSSSTASTAIMAELPPEQTSNVMFLTVHAPGKSWIEGNNERIRALPTQFPNASVVDWDAIATAYPDLITSDGVHLRNPTAIDTYTTAITDAYT